MINPKYIGIAAGVGFVFSFLIGIFSGVGFGLVLLRALICALIFGAVSAGASILFHQFLSDEHGQFDAGADSSAEKAAGGAKVGGTVDFTVGDDSLPEDDKGPRFDVGATRSALRAGGFVQGVAQKNAAPSAPPRYTSASNPVSPVRQETVASAEPVVSAPKTEASGESAGFVPVNLAAGTAPVQQVASAVPTESPASGGSMDELDELPDISGFSSETPRQESSGDDEVVHDSDFATEGEPPSRRSATFSNGKPVAEQNAAVMAQAIRTILAKN